VSVVKQKKWPWDSAEDTPLVLSFASSFEKKIDENVTNFSKI
jgi:hypothetical protein